MKLGTEEGENSVCYAFLEPRFIEQLSIKLNQQENKPGLYLVATPIGNIFDISLRALKILASVDVIFAEDTRNSIKLLNAYGIRRPLVACHEYNEADESVTSAIHEGRMYALISDAGTPGISDPGYRIVNWCIEHDIDIVPIPGPCAFITGLCASGFPTDSFSFYGFISPKTNSRKEFLMNIKNRKEVSIFLESPQRIVPFLKDVLDTLGDRNCCLCRELTKLHETFHRSRVSEQIAYFNEYKPLGEFVIVLQGSDKGAVAVTNEEAEKHLVELIKTRSIKEAVQIVSSAYGIPRKIVYKKALELK